jgi:hypothetical protein
MKGWHVMTRHNPHAITIDDERYPGKSADVLAWDLVTSATAWTTTLLLRGASGQYVVHQHLAPNGDDSLKGIDGEVARALYRRMRMHVVPFEEVRSVE